jgi:hypothetical protein
MSDATNSERSSNLPTILAILILCVLVGLGIGAWMSTRMQRASAELMELLKGGEPFVLAWLGDIRAGRVAEAYDATTSDVRSRMDRPGFEKFVAEHPEFKAPPVVITYSTVGGRTGWSIGLNGLQNDETPSRFVLIAALRPENEGEPCKVEIVAIKDRASGRLLIDQFKIVPVPPAKP